MILQMPVVLPSASTVMTRGGEGMVYQGSHRDVASLGKGQSVLSMKVVVMGEFDGDQMMNSGKCGGRRRSSGVDSGG